MSTTAVLMFCHVMSKFRHVTTMFSHVTGMFSHVISNSFFYCSCIILQVHIHVSNLPSGDASTPGTLVVANGTYSLCSTVTPHCYISPILANGLSPFSTPVQTWSQRWCSNYSASLVVIDNPAVQNDVITFVNNVNSVDLTSSDTSYLPDWFYTAGEAVGADIGGAVKWYNLNTTTPAVVLVTGQNASQDLSYASITVSNNTQTLVTYIADTAVALKGYICQYPGSSPQCISAPSTADNINNYCFVVHEDQLGWYSARNLCLLSGGDLAAVNTGSYYQLANLTAIMNATNQYWIGLRNSWWSWTTNTGSLTDLTYSYWANGVPMINSYNLARNFLCMCIASTGTWQLCACNTASPFRLICKINLITTSSANPLPTSKTSTLLYVNGLSAATTTSGANNSLVLPLSIGLGEGATFLVIIVVVIIVVVIVFNRMKRKSAGTLPTSNDYSTLDTPVIPNTTYSTTIVDSRHYSEINIAESTRIPARPKTSNSLSPVTIVPAEPLYA